MIQRLPFLLIAFAASLAAVQVAAQAPTALFHVADLAVNQLSEPTGLDDGPLAFSWKLQSDARDLRQTAYRVVVSEPANRSDSPLWDSGVVLSDNSLSVLYEGPQPKSRQRLQWLVQVWSNQTEDRSVASATGNFEMGLLEPSDWTARWIGAKKDGASLEPTPAPLFRKSFAVKKQLASARAYVSGLGYFRMTLNGQPVSDHVLDPVVTHYDRRTKYLVFDIADQLRSGENAIGITLGNGWFNQHTPSAWDFDTAPWRNNPRLIAQIELRYADGSQTVIASDEDWRWAEGPITFDGIRNGVHYDASREIPGWDEPGFDESAWQRALRVQPPTDTLSPQLMPPARVVETLPVADSRKLSDTLSVLDFGRNTTGRAVIQVSGPPGASLTLRYGERVHPDGSLDQKEIARFIRTGVPQTDRYIIGPSGSGSFEPYFMYHGFQYIEIETSSPKVRIDDIHANIIHTDLQRTGGFESSNALLNELYAVSLNSFLTNYHSYPTDCPHREKIGWTGDGQLVMDFGLFNFDSATAYSKWVDDMQDEQRPNGQVPGIIPTSGWGYHLGRGPDPHGYRTAGYGPQWEGVCVSLPWTLYLNTGDIHTLRKRYPMMKAYHEFLNTWSEDGVLRIGIDDHKWVRLQTQAPIIATAYHYHIARILESAARVLDHDRDLPSYQSDQNRIKTGFNREFLDETTGVYDNGSQTSQALALAFDLVPKTSRHAAIERLVESIRAQDNHPIAGVVGVRALVDTLPTIGRSDLLYAMATQTEMPSWGWWLEQGATTLWQNWDGSQSRNHIMFGSVNDFFYENLAGIQLDPAHPGYKHFFIKPDFIEALDRASAWHEGPFGRIRSSWEREGGTLSLSVQIPPNSSATLRLPTADWQAISESGNAIDNTDGLQKIVRENGYTLLTLGSGAYQFKLPTP